MSSLYLPRSSVLTEGTVLGFSQPTLVSQNGQILSTGGSYTASGSIVGAIAYLQTGACGLNGDNCLSKPTELTLDCSRLNYADPQLSRPR